MKEPLFLKILFCCTLLVGFHAGAQSKRMLEYQADLAVKRKDWHVAAQHYARLLARDTGSLRIRYQLAEVCRMDYDIDQALRQYAYVVKKDEKSKYPLSNYWLGHLYKSKAQYVEAKKRFLVFLSFKSDKPEFQYFNTRAKMEVEACDLAPQLMQKPVSVKMESFGSPVNTKASEFAPLEMDSVFYFSSMKTIESKGEDPEILNNRIYRSDYKNGKWQKVKALDTSINKPAFHNSNVTFSADGKKMFFSRCMPKNETEYNCDLYGAEWKNKKWEAEKKLAEPVNLPGYNSSMPQVSILDGRQVLFFCSDRPGGQGGLDIWYCFRTDSGTYSPAINAGNQVNTPEDELSPWFSQKEKLLYFSSSYHKGLGGYDIFKSSYTNGGFTEPVNAGYPINTSHNDMYYSVNKRSTRVYISSNRQGTVFEGKKPCNCNDIYSFNIDTVKIKEPPKPPVIEPPKKVDTVVVMKEQLKLLVPLTLYFHNDEPDPHSRGITTTRSYESTFKEYEAMLPHYADEYGRGLKGGVKENAVNEITTFFNDSLESGFHNLQKFCATLKKVLLNNETVKITLKGYCSPLASTDYNINLAKRRVSSLLNYINQYDNGFFTHYLDNKTEKEGKLLIEEEDIGELGTTHASDDLKDKRNSVYSPHAAAERKIQILAIRFD